MNIKKIKLHYQYKFKVQKFLPKNQFNKNDITLIKNSDIYQMCSTNLNHLFYIIYNQAIDEYADLIVKVKEFNDIQEKAKQQQLLKSENFQQLILKTFLFQISLIKFISETLNYSIQYKQQEILLLLLVIN
ncbi:unnamed protein product [Paramecium sonneborni]|uniref:Uncharacterized protein n=1 Tax=Paramecium sonneborni TaxID=65129 RepID=A0A8S1MQ49_9CILI|nr:unnamed protein product [Paramecium sonneborni]